VSDCVTIVILVGNYKCSSEKQVQMKNTATGRWRVREQGAWAVCECIFCTGDGGQLGCSLPSCYSSVLPG